MVGVKKNRRPSVCIYCVAKSHACTNGQETFSQDRNKSSRNDRIGIRAHPSREGRISILIYIYIYRVFHRNCFNSISLSLKNTYQFENIQRISYSWYIKYILILKSIRCIFWLNQIIIILINWLKLWWLKILLGLYNIWTIKYVY